MIRFCYLSLLAVDFKLDLMDDSVTGQFLLAKSQHVAAHRTIIVQNQFFLAQSYALREAFVNVLLTWIDFKC